ncbi:MAG: hypothetical protein ACRYGP_09270, partial [Janthinobacterium lividum]
RHLRRQFAVGHPRTAISRQAGRCGTPPDRSIAQSLALASLLTAALLLCTLAGWTSIALVAFVMAGSRSPSG